MAYLIYSTELDAIERNHAESTKRHWRDLSRDGGRGWIPLTYKDGPYWWAFVKHPSNGEVALVIPETDADPEAGVLDAGEIADLDAELTPDWTPTDV